MGQTREQKARKIGIIYAKKMTKEFQKENMRGEKFRWSNAPDMFATHISSILFIYFPDKTQMKELNKIAYDSCYEKTKKIIEKLSLQDDKVDV